MKVLVFGSLNIDYTYKVHHFVQAGETVQSFKMDKNAGGKGFNQALALAKAGANPYFAGMIGQDGIFLKDLLFTHGVEVGDITISDTPTGNAIIQVDETGENCILLFGGANQTVDGEKIDTVLSHFEQGDYLLVQNEISHLPMLIEKAHQKGMRIVLNPSPITKALLEIPVSHMDTYILNEVEAEQITGATAPDDIFAFFLTRNSACKIVLTLGEKGAYYADEGQTLFAPAKKVDAVDTTAAGDTFTGYFLHHFLQTGDVKKALTIASNASAITVSRHGAGESIPFYGELSPLE